MEVTPTDSDIDLQLMVGMQPDLSPDTACIEIAIEYVTTITLDEPLIGRPAG